ncbi:MAG: DUF4388 domain-containing protein [Deltaproteobacteria bacterium]|nr:DUF4388 domain-containing protein [Deltaproteobacteria bacterium]
MEEPYKEADLLAALDEQLALYANAAADPEPETAAVAPSGEVDPFGHIDDEAFDSIDAALAAADIASHEMSMIESEHAVERTARAKVRRAVSEKSPPKKRAEGRPSAAMAIDAEGDLSETSFPEIVAEIFFSEKTGVLTITHRQNEKKVYFRAGRPVHVEERCATKRSARCCSVTGSSTRKRTRGPWPPWPNATRATAKPSWISARSPPRSSTRP